MPFLSISSFAYTGDKKTLSIFSSTSSEIQKVQVPIRLDVGSVRIRVEHLRMDNLNTRIHADDHIHGTWARERLPDELVLERTGIVQAGSHEVGQGAAAVQLAEVHVYPGVYLAEIFRVLQVHIPEMDFCKKEHYCSYRVQQYRIGPEQTSKQKVLLGNGNS